MNPESLPVGLITGEPTMISELHRQFRPRSRSLPLIFTESDFSQNNSVEPIDHDYVPDATYYDFTELDFNINEYNLSDVLSLIKFYPLSVFQFKTIDDNKFAYGQGSIRQVYLKLMSDLISDNDNTIFHSDGKWNSRPNLKHEFWNNNSDLQAFGRFITLVIVSECTFPFRLPLRLIEVILGRRFTTSELMFFLEKKDEVLFKSISKIHPNDFVQIKSLGFISYYHLVRTKVLEPKAKSISEFLSTDKYKIIAQEISLFGHGSPSASTIDWILSGEYTITAEMIIQITDIFSEHQNLWADFVKALTSAELKGLMIAFTNSLDMNKKIRITVGQMDTDLEISTCYRMVDINEKLFKSIDVLLGLRIYFQDRDQISEKTTTTIYPLPAGEWGNARIDQVLGRSLRICSHNRNNAEDSVIFRQSANPNYLREMIRRADEYLESPAVRRSIFGDTTRQYEYTPLVRISSPNEHESNPSQQPNRSNRPVPEPTKKKKKNKKTSSQLESVKLQQRAQQRRRR
jgi:hypothetical protein